MVLCGHGQPESLLTREVGALKSRGRYSDPVGDKVLPIGTASSAERLGRADGGWHENFHEFESPSGPTRRLIR